MATTLVRVLPRRVPSTPRALGGTSDFSNRRIPKRSARRGPRYADNEDDGTVGVGSVLSAKEIERVLDDEARRMRAMSGDAMSPISDGRQRRWAALMEKKKERKLTTAYLQQPLFRVDSPAAKAFGPRSLLDYDVVPTGHFQGPIHIILTPEDEAQHAATLESMTVVGVDCESRPEPFSRRDPPVAMVQIASQDQAFLYRIRCNSPDDGLPITQPTFPALQALLANPKVVKIGHGCKSDFQGIKKDGIAPEIRSTLDTLPVATRVGCLKPNLAALGLIWQRLRIDKSMQTSDWECTTLSPEQIQYAATDAWMARQVMLALLQFAPARSLVQVIDYLPERTFYHPKQPQAMIARLQALAQAENVTRTWEETPPRTGCITM
ncbi:3'-5' exonuclease [Achlya hypogyna]|uniref:3'-5' exonuclease n=1 Tax=Achlya hypogyna TaxID=1202772 RepID=A0A1V9YNT2_ACHHY|nr:3'-5' exonuclease [Achlya hypogyna]